MKHKPRNILNLQDRFKDVFTPTGILKQTAEREDYRPHFERLQAIRVEDASNNARRSNKARIRQVMVEVEGIQEPLKLEIDQLKKNLRYLKGTGAAMPQAQGGVR